MKSIIEELWYGNAIPMESIIPPTTQEEELSRLMECNRTKLLDSLTEEQKTLFEKYDDALSELNVLFEKQSFEYGFKLGTRIVIETIG